MSKSNEKLSPEKQSAIADLWADGHSKREIARQLEMSDSTVRKYLEKMGVEALQSAADPKNPLITMGRQIARQADTIRQLRAQVKAVNERGYGYDDFMDELQALVEKEKLKPLTYFPTQIQKAKALSAIPSLNKDHKESVVLALSDWHITETVKLADANFINRYNTMIAANRLYSIVQKFKHIVTMHMAMYKIEKIVLLCC